MNRLKEDYIPLMRKLSEAKQHQFSFVHEIPVKTPDRVKCQNSWHSGQKESKSCICTKHQDFEGSRSRLDSIFIFFKAPGLAGIVLKLMFDIL